MTVREDLMQLVLARPPARLSAVIGSIDSTATDEVTGDPRALVRVPGSEDLMRCHILTALWPEIESAAAGLLVLVVFADGQPVAVGSIAKAVVVPDGS